MSGKSASDYKQDYTKPDLRERLKEKIKASSKGGRSGQWSARKSQLLTHEYESQGGDYKHRGERTTGQQDLRKWTDEKWQTKSGKARARHGATTERYLPKETWEKLSPAERKKTNQRKIDASRKGQQFVSNTKSAKKARLTSKFEHATLDELYSAAKRLDIAGRSKMSKDELLKALQQAN